MLSLKSALTKDLEAEVDRLARRLEDERRRNREELDLLRKQMARVARGARLDAAALMEGRLWSEVPPGALTDFVRGTRDLLVLDVRTDGEWSGGRIPGARHIPIGDLGRRLAELSADKDRPILAYCAAGGRSAAACDLLSQHGFLNLHNAAGGIGAYKGPLDR